MNSEKEIIPVTASMLYDIIMCEHRAWMDLYGDPKLRDDASPFVEMLWRRGHAHEQDVIAQKGPYFDAKSYPAGEREAATLAAMQRREPLIYGGRISHGDLLGEPDVLRHAGDGLYLAGDIKSGAGEEEVGEDDRRPKKRYAVQLALYVDVLERIGLSAGRRAFVWDIHCDEIPYDFTAPKSAKNAATLWNDYEECLAVARGITGGAYLSRPAYSSDCKQCWWYNACIEDLRRTDDLTLLPELGRSRREPLRPHATSVAGFAAMKPESLLDEKGKSILKGFGESSIAKFHARAVLHASGGPAYARTAIALPDRQLEIFWDIETDPLRDHCYLHGFIERGRGGDMTEKYVPFFSVEPTPEAERDAFAAAWEYARSSQPCTFYIYSKYERTWWRKLQHQYPDVCSAEEVEAMFDPTVTVDLYYDVVLGHTEWPTNDYSLKTLARYNKFAWRDSHPSGAASIEWYDRYVLTRDPEARQRILDYNEDDCRATLVLLDAIRRLPVSS